MSGPQSAPEPQRRPPGGYSPDCVDVVYDGPANANHEPPLPASQELFRATREKLIRYGEIKAPPAQPADTPAESAPPPVVPEAANGVLRVPLDASLLLRLHGLDRPVELVDANGKVVARVTPTATPSDPGPKHGN